MITQSIDRKTISWIKQEIQETLKSVQDAPDKFAENFDDVSPIESLIAPLQRVRGAVEIASIQGATLLANELAQLCQALTGNKVKDKTSAVEALATGMLQLPAYLESLYQGQADIPLILLPQLNDIRAAQGRELLTAGEFFNPDFSVDAPTVKEKDCIVSGDLSHVAKILRPHYLVGLLGFIRNENTLDNIIKLNMVIDNLLIASVTDKAKQFWWIASGLLVSLKEDSLKPSIAIKILLGRVDGWIKRAIDSEEKLFTDDPPYKVMKNLLYYIGQSESEPYNEAVMGIKSAFNLDYPEDSTIEKAREGMYGFSVNLFDNITKQIKEELASIKDALDICMHANAGSTKGLEPVLNHFNTVIDALNMIGISRFSNAINEYREFLEIKISRGESLDEEDLMNIATAILYVESSLANDCASGLAANNNSTLPQEEYENLLKTTATEILSDIKGMKSAIDEFSIDQDKFEQLSRVPKFLENIIGAMHMLGHSIQLHLSQALLDYINKELIKSEKPAGDAALDNLADVIMGLENYYLSILEKSLAPDIGLKIAYQSISKLGFTPDSEVWDISNDQDEMLIPRLGAA